MKGDWKRIWGTALVSIPWIPDPPAIDGALDDAVWRAAPEIALRVMATGARPTRPTRARLAWSHAKLFVSFDCLDPRPFATLTERDAPLWREEVVELFLCPDSGSHRYLEIEISPTGVVYDAWVDATSGRPILEGSTDFDLEGLTASVARSEGGWRAEISVPLDELPDPIAHEMRLNLTRIERPADDAIEYQTWAPTQRWFHEPERWPTVELGPAAQPGF